MERSKGIEILKRKVISMNVSKKLYQTNKLVKTILEDDERARNSDSHLYLQVLYEVGMIEGIDVNAMSVSEFLEKRDLLNFPCFETVRRTRQKLQATFPELAANDEVKKKRKENESVYKAYAQSKAIKIGE